MTRARMNKTTQGLCLLIAGLLALFACGPMTAATPVPAAVATATLAPTQPIATLAPTQPAALPTDTNVPVATSTQAPATIEATAPPPDNGRIARQHLEALSETIGPRASGSKQEAQAAEYIQAALEAMGYEPQVQPFSFRTEDDATLDSANVIAIKAGSSPKAIIVGAHYDSGDEGRGADDNASGAGVMLEVAQKIKDIPTPYTIRFIAFGAEENDLDGSRYYVDQMSQSDIQNTVGMINLDSLSVGDQAYVYGDEGAGSLHGWILKTAQDAGFSLETKAAQELDYGGEPCECADYGPFQAAGIPFAYFEATNWNLGEEDGMTQVALKFGERGKIWHTRYDNVKYIDSTFPGRIDQHLTMFVTLLYDTLTQFKSSD